MKTVIITWKQEVKNMIRHGLHNYWGFGDMIRGACGMFDVCEELGYKIYVDMRHHPVHHFFEHIEHGFESQVDEKRDDIILDLFHTRTSIIEKLRREFDTSDVYINAVWVNPYIYSNDISPKNKQFIKTILTPTREFNDYILVHMPPTPYNIIHFRLGDALMFSSTLTGYDKYVQLIHRYGKPHDIVLSDNDRLKKIVRDTLSDTYNVTDIEPCHVGVETNLEKIKGTLYEFILASRATHIYAYSNYGGMSGFVYTINRIYDIPVKMIL